MVTRRLIFHFYVYDGWEQNPVYHIHKYFLSKYSHIFNKAIFIISVEDVNNWKLIKNAESFLLDCKFKSIQFTVNENTRLYEVETFDRYILKKMEKLDGLTFFGHVKGISDYNNAKMDREAIMIWVSSLYYLGLEFYKEAEWAAYTAKSCFFGGPMVFYDENSKLYLPKNLFMYSGTFYWLNGKEIHDRFNGKYPEIKDRYYAEHFPGNLCHRYDYEACSHNYMMASASSIGADMFKSEEIAKKYIAALLKEEGEMDAFMNEYNNLKKYLAENGISY